MNSHDFLVTFDSGGRPTEVPARHYEAEGHRLAWLVLAPGAGAGHDHPFMVSFAHGLASRGLDVVTFDFAYRYRGRRVPDTASALEAAWLAVLSAVAERAGGGAALFAGGKSMGGRIASQVAARLGPEEGEAHPTRPAIALRGLVFLGYPLHPPGKPVQRTAHWPKVLVPALFVQGSRDPFGAPEELREQLPRFGGETTLLVVDGGGHSLEVPRKAGRPQDDVYAGVQDAIATWVGERSR
jgi:uncharacterized protein